MYTVLQTEEFRDWLDALRDKKAQIRVVARLRMAEGGNLGNWKSLGEGLSEMKIDFGPGYRLYFTKRQNVVIVMIGGGDKSSQTFDIRRAKRRLAELDTEP